jgi:catechol 2,3-dioxygenase-like lactoylglutathione lyase family enzyme
MQRPPATAGMRHIALSVEWRPDADNLYLTSGNDNLALHRVDRKADPAAQTLDHIGFILRAPEEVDAWYEFLRANGVEMKSAPRTHRDGARSFYCLAPQDVTLQMIFHPPIADH